jgi:hypothetical protein
MSFRTLASSVAMIVALNAQAIRVYAQKNGPMSATVPLHSDTNTAIIELDFRRPDGSTRKAKFVVDTGGGAFIMGAQLAKDLALQRVGPIREMEDGHGVQSAAPKVSMGGMDLDLSGDTTIISLDTNRVFSRDDAEGLMPSSLLKKYHVIFDYPANEFTLARPGSLRRGFCFRFQLMESSEYGGQSGSKRNGVGFTETDLAVTTRAFVNVS